MSDRPSNEDDRVSISEQVDWANDCNDIRRLAKTAEHAVRREEYEMAHKKLNELRGRLDDVSEEYPRHIHDSNCADTPRKTEN